MLRAAAKGMFIGLYRAACRVSAARCTFPRIGRPHTPTGTLAAVIFFRDLDDIAHSIRDSSPVDFCAVVDVQKQEVAGTYQRLTSSPTRLASTRPNSHTSVIGTTLFRGRRRHPGAGGSPRSWQQLGTQENCYMAHL
jgi:hypothetical protein